MENLPVDVLTNIFIRLLAKQLAQMRCVSKSLNSLLSESQFVKSHLHHSVQNNDDEIILFFRNSIRKTLTACGYRSIVFPVEIHGRYAYAEILGSVDGLICFGYRSNHDYVVHIWNPSISALLTLPPCSLPAQNSTPSVFLFGFDPKTDDYKVVKFARESQSQVQVYSMRKGSWELITQRFPSHLTMDSKPDVVGVDGHLYWLGFSNLERTAKTIVAFDLGAETFLEIPLPLPHSGHCLGVLDGKLCLMSQVEYCKWAIWVMDDNGVAKSWVKHHVFSRFSLKIIPLGFTLHNEVLFIGGGCEFALYDPIAHKAKRFTIPDGVIGIHKVVKYVDSLVWVSTAERKMSIS